MTSYQRKTCRSCGQDRLRSFLSLGPTPLANSFLSFPAEFAEEPVYPLDVYFCETCSLVQLMEVVDPEILFRDYIYVTGTSDTITAHSQEYAHTIIELIDLSSEDLIIEIASNNGILLKCLQKHGITTLGIEPAENIAALANDDGVNTIARFFDSAVAQDVREDHGPARVVICNNVLAHVDETQGFLHGCKHLLADDGLVMIEVPYLKEFVDRLEYDTVYHEHLCYFSVTSLMHLCDVVGLSIMRIDHLPIHGGSLRMYAGKREQHMHHAPEVVALAKEEHESKLTDFNTYEQFALKVKRTREKLLFLLHTLQAEGKTVAAYGAPAKGNTLLNYCGITTDLVPYTVDKNPLKVGLYTPGAHLPVFPVSTLLENQPDYVLILAWNFAEEIMLQQHEYRATGGRFIIPIPEPKVV